MHLHGHTLETSRTANQVLTISPYKICVKWLNVAVNFCQDKVKTGQDTTKFSPQSLKGIVATTNTVVPSNIVGLHTCKAFWK